MTAASLNAWNETLNAFNESLVPNLNDWSQAGKVLARLAIEYGYEEIGKGRLTNDALIAMSAARQGITVITANQRDFARLARFRNFRYEVKSGVSRTLRLVSRSS